MRRDQDSVNPRTHPDVMMLAPDGAAHPYLYARVIGIFHVMAFRAGDDLEGNDDTEPELIHVLWVRWFDLDTRAPGGLKARRLPRLKWAALDDDAFGFVAPGQVLRAAHLIPAFAHGQSDAALPGYSVARHEDEDDTDWKYHYVGMYVQLHFYYLRMLIEHFYSFVDRDMFMRYYGGAVGHQHGGAGRSQLPEDLEPITELRGEAYGHEIDDEPDIGNSAAADTQDSDSEGEGSEDEADEDVDERETELAGEDDGDNDGDLGPEDGEVPMGEDEAELTWLGFAPM